MQFELIHLPTENLLVVLSSLLVLVEALVKQLRLRLQEMVQMLLLLLKLLSLTQSCLGQSTQLLQRVITCILLNKFHVLTFLLVNTVEAAGGQCLPCIVDVRDELMVQTAVDQAVKKFGGIDIVVNNASAISLTGTLETTMKKYDLMHHCNTRGTYLV